MSTQSSLQLGTECLKSGKIDEAIQYLEKATMEFPQDYRGFNFLGIAYAQKGLHNRAIGSLEVAKKLHPRSASIHFNLGLAYHADGFSDRAKEHFEEALKIDPTYARASQALRGMLHQEDSILSQGCARHTDEPAIGLCQLCRLPMCLKCRTVVGTQTLCEKCAEKVRAQPR